MFLNRILGVSSRLMKRIRGVIWRMFDIWFLLFQLTMSYMGYSSILEPDLLSMQLSWLVRAKCHQTRREHPNLLRILFYPAMKLSSGFVFFLKSKTLNGLNSGLNSIDQVSHHFTILFISDCISSSFRVRYFGRLVLNNINNKGPKTDHWGTLLPT